MTIEQSILNRLAEGPATTGELRIRVNDEVRNERGLFQGWIPLNHSIRGRISRLRTSGRIVRIGRGQYRLAKSKTETKRLATQLATA